MRKALSVRRKEVRQILRDRRSLVVLLFVAEPDPARSNFRYTRSRGDIEGPQGLPLLKGPYAELVAIRAGNNDLDLIRAERTDGHFLDAARIERGIEARVQRRAAGVGRDEVRARREYVHVRSLFEALCAGISCSTPAFSAAGE